MHKDPHGTCGTWHMARAMPRTEELIAGAKYFGLQTHCPPDQQFASLTKAILLQKKIAASQSMTEHVITHARRDRKPPVPELLGTHHFI